MKTHPVHRIIGSVACAGLISCLCFASCREQEPPKSGPSSTNASATHAPTTEAGYDSLLDHLCTLQDSVRNNPAAMRLFPILVNAAFDTNTGCFLTVGKGVANKAMPEATWISARKTAAKSDALRWAMYLKAWRTGKMIRFGQPVTGEIMYSKSLYSRDDGDTTYVLLQVPIGSIDVR